MPLITDNIFEARASYTPLEVRSAAAEQNVSLLTNTLANLTVVQQSTAQSARILKDFSINQLQDNSQLNVQHAAAVSPDITLDSFIASLGMATALGEASMPDRTIPSVNV